MAVLTDTDGALITEDTFLWRGKPDLNESGSTTLICAGESGLTPNLQRWFIIEWDLSATALVGATINTAKVTFDVFRALGTARSIEARRVKKADMDWTYTTWNDFKRFFTWQAGGAQGALDTARFGITLNGPTATGSWDYTGLANLVTDAMDARSGILRIIWWPDLWKTITDKLIVRSVDYATGSSRPTLVVDYTPASTGKRYSIGGVHGTAKEILSG